MRYALPITPANVLVPSWASATRVRPPLDRSLAASDDTARPMLSIQTAAEWNEGNRARPRYIPCAGLHAHKRPGYLSSGMPSSATGGGWPGPCRPSWRSSAGGEPEAGENRAAICVIAMHPSPASATARLPRPSSSRSPFPSPCLCLRPLRPSPVFYERYRWKFRSHFEATLYPSSHCGTMATPISCIHASPSFPPQVPGMWFPMTVIVTPAPPWCRSETIGEKGKDEQYARVVHAYLPWRSTEICIIIL